MNTLLIFFAFPIAVIIISAILEKLLKNPIAVAAFIFAVFLVVTFAAFTETFLIATLAYTIISFITATIVYFLKHRRNNNRDLCDLLAEIIRNREVNNNNNGNNNACLSNTVEELLYNSTNNISNLSSNNNNCGCNHHRRR